MKLSFTLFALSFSILSFSQNLTLTNQGKGKVIQLKENKKIEVYFKNNYSVKGNYTIKNDSTIILVDTSIVVNDIVAIKTRFDKYKIMGSGISLFGATLIYIGIQEIKSNNSFAYIPIGRFTGIIAVGKGSLFSLTGILSFFHKNEFERYAGWEFYIK